MVRVEQNYRPSAYRPASPRRPGSLEKLLFATARFGWGVLRDAWTLLQVAVGLALAGVPLLLVSVVTDRYYPASVPALRLPLAVVVIATAVALTLSLLIVLSLYRSSLRCRRC